MSLRMLGLLGATLVTSSLRQAGGECQPLAQPKNMPAIDALRGTGYREIDRVMRDGLLNHRYAPATLDGRAVEVWLHDARVELVQHKP